jgi:hypothetical protein
MKNTLGMKSYYLEILTNLGIYSDITEDQFDIIYKRYKQLGGKRELIYNSVKKRLKNRKNV